MTETVEIGGRVFKVGSWYAPRNGKAPARRLTNYKYAWWVETWCVWYDTASGHWSAVTVPTWLRWAGEEVQP